MSTYNKFEGTSTNGNFQEALDKAVAAAQAAEPGADMITKWRLEETRGEEGGLKPRNNVTVVIETL